MRSIGRPGAMSVGTRPEPNFAPLLDGIVALAVNHDRTLPIHLDLVFDSLADEQRRLGFAADHSRGHFRAHGRENFDVLRPNRDADRLSGRNPIRVITASEDNAIPRAVESDRHLTRRIAVLHLAPEEHGLAEKISHELVGGLFVKLTRSVLLLHHAGVHYGN